jgi:hypothetical protein
MRFPIKKNTFSRRHGGNLKPSPLQPVLPLVPKTLPTKEQDKSKFISFELKSRAGQPAGSTTYKKFVRVFKEGMPQQWINLIHDLEEIWTQNSVNGPTDRVLTIRNLLEGESLTAFDKALEDVRVDPDPDEQAPLQLTLEHIIDSMDQVADTVFPHRALEIQKLWMNQGMRHEEANRYDDLQNSSGNHENQQQSPAVPTQYEWFQIFESGIGWTHRVVPSPALAHEVWPWWLHPHSRNKSDTHCGM